MTISSDLRKLLKLRQSTRYQVAERTRQLMGAAAMAKCPPSSDEFKGLLRMVDVWDTIAHRVLKKKSLTKPYFQTSPVGYMWNRLSPGIRTLRQGKYRRGGAYAKEFRSLNGAYRKWLKRQPAQYKTAAKLGMGAQFG